MEIRLDRCVVRSWRLTDATSLVRHANNRNVWRNLRDRFPHPYTDRDADRWIRSNLNADPETNYAIEVDGEVVGAIGLQLQEDIHRRSAEIGYWVGEAFWGRGIATEALRAVTEHAFSTFDLCRLFAGTFEWNPASRRVLEKAGYVSEGRLRQSVTKDGETIDMILYARVREESD